MEWLTDHLQGFGLAVASFTVIPALWYTAKAKLPGILAKWVLAEVKQGLQGGGATDADLQQMVKAITMAAVIYAEKKLPGDGLGQQKTDLILALGRKVSWLAPFINSNEANIRELIDLCVKELDAGLVEVLKPQP